MALNSFTGKITFLFAVLVTATVALVLALGDWQLELAAVSGLDFLNQAEFTEVNERLGPAPERFSAAEIEARLRSHSEIDASQFYFQVHDAAGRLLFRSANLGAAVLPDLTGEAQTRTTTIAGLGVMRVAEFQAGALHVQIASSFSAAERLLKVDRHTTYILLGCVALLSGGVGWTFARLALRPVRAIRETASRISADNLGERLPVPAGRDEIAALAALLNEMLARLEASFQQVKRFTADASHELKTPLALVRLNAEKLRPRLAADAEGSEALDELMEDIDRMRRIIESLLFLTKADSGGMAPVRGKFEIGAFVRGFAEDAQAMADDRGARFRLAGTEAGVMTGEETLLRQLLLNLMSNACRAVEAGGEVSLESRVEGGVWRVSVSDTGPGLPPDQLERVFERFVRFTAPGRAPEAEGGHGLGLAICRSIVRLHGGRIRAENRRDVRGLRLIVELPIAPDFRL